MPVKWMSVLLLLQMSCYLRSGNCGKVLVWPMEYSHWMNLKTILDELVQRGHEVTVLRTSASIFLDPQKSPGLKFESFSTSISKDDLDKVYTMLVDVWTYEIPRDLCLSFSPLLQNVLNEYSDSYLSLCRDTVSNKQLMTKLQRSKFDVLFSDAFAPCGELIAELLQIPFLYSLRFSPGYTMEKYRRPTTLTETIGKAEMWLIRSYWDLEFPRPTLPNVDYVGGLHCKPAKPLPKEMEDFVQTSGEHGVVVFSLGSMVSNMSEDKANAIAWALAQIPQKSKEQSGFPALCYKKNAMWLSTIHHDQPMKPLDRAIFWIEFVMRHKGAKHLRPLAHNLTWYQYHSLDVIGFLLACVATIAYLSIKSFLFIYQKFVKTGKKTKRE
ncbi:UDP-glucuronosyltransferase 2B37 [Microtus ochrogaster]|uniref:glucuronosyltransferase n=1 Tax=Microtus ochrogaster TaxID=79684 RepID=A0A8J6FV64_MICOH|nr:UDP-glucuronosyltransferase 2B37 [Microtus ochrogaster]